MQPAAEALGVVAAEQAGQLLTEHPARAARRTPSARRRRRAARAPPGRRSRPARGRWPARPGPAPSRRRASMSRCTIADAPSGGSGPSQPLAAASTRSAGTRASAPPPVPWPSSTASVGALSITRSCRQRAISPASPPSSASRDSAAPGVSISVTSGSRSSSARCMPRRASRSAGRARAGRTVLWPRRSCPSTTHGAPPKRASASSSPGSFSPGAGAAKPDDVGGRGPQQPADARPVLPPGGGDDVPGAAAVLGVVGVGAVLGGRPLGAADVDVPGLPGGEHPQRPVGDVADLLVRDDGVDQPALGQVLGGLHALGERLAVQRLVDPRPEEADRGAGLGDRHVPERAPGRQHAAEGGVAQVDEVGQPGLLVPGDRRGDADHLQEGDRALLHPGAAGDRARPAAAAPPRWPARRRRSAARRRRPRWSRRGSRTPRRRRPPAGRAAGPRR